MGKKLSLLEFIILMAPYAPHFCEEIWEKIGESSGSLFSASYPVFESSFLVEDAYDYPVSFNGKMRFKVKLALNLKKEELETQLLKMEETNKWLNGKVPRKVIIVPGKIVNFVV